MNTSKNTSSKAGRPSTKLVYPAGSFTISQLFALNQGRIKWELSARQHVAKEQARRWVTKLNKTVKTGAPGKPADLYTLTKWGQRKLEVQAAPTHVEVSMETPSAPEAVAVTVTEAPVGWETISAGTENPS
jgi:hypothetical protein